MGIDLCVAPNPDGNGGLRAVAAIAGCVVWEASVSAPREATQGDLVGALHKLANALAGADLRNSTLK